MRLECTGIVVLVILAACGSVLSCFRDTSCGLPVRLSSIAVARRLSCRQYTSTIMVTFLGSNRRHDAFFILRDT